MRSHAYLARKLARHVRFSAGSSPRAFSAKCFSPNRQPGFALGFTLVELVVTLAVAGILLTVAIPAFTSIMAQNQLAAVTNAARGALMATRQSAVMLGRPVSICAGTPDAGCTGDWSAGEWLIFQDRDHSGNLDEDEPIVRHGDVPGAGGRVSLDGNGPFRTAMVYMPMGHAERISGAFGAGRIRVCIESNLSPNARELVVSASGRVRLEQVDFDGTCPAL